MKVVIPAAGSGTRLRPHTFSTPKPLLFVAGKPMIGHVLDSLKDVDIDELILVISEDGGAIRDYVQAVTSANVTSVTQVVQRGLGDAVYLARDIVKDSELLIILGDTIVDMDLADQIAAGDDFLGVKKVRDPRRFGVVQVKNDNVIVGLEEKPQKPKSNLIVAGVYYFKNSSLLFENLDHIVKNDIRTKGEYQITDALRQMLKKEWKPRAVEIREWLDCGKFEAMLHTNQTLLERHSKIREFEKSLVIPPVYIEDEVDVTNSIIGPNVSVDRGVKIMNSIIMNSILNEEAFIEKAIVRSSVIGKRAQVSGRIYELNLGDLCKIKL
jgi:glucose-1-phosphate thymidylyltransferase